MTRQTASNIKSLAGLPGIRHRVSMYAGSSDSDGMLTAIREMLDNCADEASAGRNKLIGLIRDTSKPNAFWVIDEGGGIPVGNIKLTNPVTGKPESVSALKAVVAIPHSGGKFDVNDDTDGQRGTHGVGIKLTNATSNTFVVWTCTDGQWYTTEYAKGNIVTEVKKCVAPKHPVTGRKLTKGTLMYAALDASVYDKGSKVEDAGILSWFEMTSAFSKGLKLFYHNGKEQLDWQSASAETYVDSQVKADKANLLEGAATFAVRTKLADVALTFTDYDGSDLRGFTNGLPNREGGTHVQAVFEALCSAVSDYAKRQHKFNPTDLREGIIGAVNVRMTACKFYNQAKTKLVDERAGKPLRDELLPLFQAFFKKNRALATTLCDRATQINGLKDEFKASKAVMKVLKDAKRKNTLPTKLAASSRCAAEDRELFIVEGDSAGGSAKRARDANFQEVLPIKGKIKNPFTSNSIESEEVLNLLIAMGYDPSSDKPFDNLRVGRVIILTDGDVDGSHIKNLIISTILAYMPQLFADGRVYASLPYEYMVQVKDDWKFALTKEDLYKQIPANARGNVMHIKGWGEVESDVLAEMAFNPEKRVLVKLSAPSKSDLKAIRDLAGSDTQARKKLLGLV